MRRKLIAAAGVIGLLALVLAVEAGPSGAGGHPPATFRVTKVVTGVAPEGTEFKVEVACPLTETGVVTFGPEGGTKDAVVSSGSEDRDCVITEEPPGGGCELAGIDPEVVSITGNTEATYSVTVTNTCPEAAPAAIAAAPTFTG